MKLLIVDDEPDLLDQLRKMLDGQRYEVDTAADGEAALDKLFENPYDLVILDIMLPKTDGLTVLLTLAEHVWGDAFDPFTMSNFIDVHLKNLRRKIGDTGEDKIIRTIRGIGFIIEDDKD